MSKEYYLYVNGQRVKVSEQIYKVYWREKEPENFDVCPVLLTQPEKDR